MYDTLRNNTYFPLAFILPATTLAAEFDDNCCALAHFVQILFFVLNGKGQHTMNLTLLIMENITYFPLQNVGRYLPCNFIISKQASLMASS